MKRAPRPRRTSLEFSSVLHNNLTGYALGAAAAGVATLALHPPAAAEIVYTATDQVINELSTVKLDLNHDGIVDFELVNFVGSTTGAGDRLFLTPTNGGNGVIPGQPDAVDRFTAAALPAGFLVSPQRTFSNRQADMAFACVDSSCVFHPIGGPWKNATNQYLGLQFLIDGKRHYGWAGLTVLAVAGDQVFATLTGYAYETVIGRPIRAGEVEGTFDEAANARPADSPSAASLGILALGSRGLTAWRREETEYRF